MVVFRASRLPRPSRLDPQALVVYSSSGAVGCEGSCGPRVLQGYEAETRTEACLRLTHYCNPGSKALDGQPHNVRM